MGITSQVCFSFIVDDFFFRLIGRFFEKGVRMPGGHGMEKILRGLMTYRLTQQRNMVNQFKKVSFAVDKI